MIGRVCCVLLLLAGTAAPASAATPHRRNEPKRAKPPAAEPTEGWILARSRDSQSLFYRRPDGGATVVAFTCAPRGSDVVISVPEASGKARPDENQTVSLTVGGVRSSFAGRVVQGADSDSLALEVVVTARNALFTALGGPGGLRIDGKGFSKSVPLRGIGAKLREFVAACRRR